MRKLAKKHSRAKFESGKRVDFRVWLRGRWPSIGVANCKGQQSVNILYDPGFSPVIATLRGGKPWTQIPSVAEKGGSGQTPSRPDYRRTREEK